jgi:hypothetical protein
MAGTESVGRLFGAIAFLTVALNLVLPGQIFATTFVPITTVGQISPEERRAQEARAREAAQTFRRQFRRSAFKGEIDSAEGIAALLIPNVREWYPAGIDTFSQHDGDGPSPTMSEIAVDAFMGSEIDGLDGSTLRDFVAPIFFREAEKSYSFDCNGELRDKFSQSIRINVNKKYRDNFYLKISNDGSNLYRKYIYVDRGRFGRPKLSVSPARYYEILSDNQNMIVKILNEFSDEYYPKLSDKTVICPIAYAKFLRERDAEIDRMRRRKSYPRLLEAAVEARARRGSGIGFPHL